jgi:hypothetical protein
MDSSLQHILVYMRSRTAGPFDICLALPWDLIKHTLACSRRNVFMIISSLGHLGSLDVSTVRPACHRNDLLLVLLLLIYSYIYMRIQNLQGPSTHYCCGHEYSNELVVNM